VGTRVQEGRIRSVLPLLDMPPALNAAPLGIILVMLLLDDVVATRRGTKPALLVGVVSLLVGVLLASHFGDGEIIMAWAGPLACVGWIWLFRTLFTTREGVAPRFTEDVQTWRDFAYMTALFVGAWAYAFAVF